MAYNIYFVSVYLDNKAWYR